MSNERERALEAALDKRRPDPIRVEGRTVVLICSGYKEAEDAALIVRALLASSPPPSPADRDMRQGIVAEWCLASFGADAAGSLPQRCVRLLEEVIEAYQAAGCDPAMAHKLIDFVFARPVGDLHKEIGAVGLVLLSLASAAGVSADAEEAREVSRVLAKPASHWAARNANKNAAGFDTSSPPPSCEMRKALEAARCPTGELLRIGMRQMASVPRDTTPGVSAVLMVWQPMLDHLLAALDASRTEEKMKLSEAQIKHMVGRFLSWKLPENFRPDAGISFKATFNDHMPEHQGKHEPSGTNLFDATQVDAMVRYMLADMPLASRTEEKAADTCEHDWSEWEPVLGGRGYHVERKCRKCGKEQYDD